MIYELDVRSICHNLLATLTRRPEAYHRKVLAGPSDERRRGQHPRPRGLQARRARPAAAVRPRTAQSLLDHFYRLRRRHRPGRPRRAREAGDFVGGVYEARLRRSTDRMQVQLTREGHVDGHPVRITKGVTLEAGSSTLEIAYLLEGLPTDRPLHFAVEFNFAGLPSGADDRYFRLPSGEVRGQLGTQLDLHEVRSDQPGRRMARHRRRLECRPPHCHLDVPGRNGQPKRRGL